MWLSLVVEASTVDDVKRPPLGIVAVDADEVDVPPLSALAVTEQV